MRNHGFILTNKGWKLSPAFDINPSYNSYGLKLNITENNNELDVKVALKVIDYFRIELKKAREIIAKVYDSIKDWQSHAKNLHIPQNEIELMEIAFNLRNLK